MFMALGNSSGQKWQNACPHIPYSLMQGDRKQTNNKHSIIQVEIKGIFLVIFFNTAEEGLVDKWGEMLPQIAHQGWDKWGQVTGQNKMREEINLTEPKPG